MNLLRYLIVFVLVLFPQLAWSLPQGKPKLPSPMGYVSDHAGVITPAWKERIRSVCQDLERKTGVEMVVVTVPSVKPYATARDYAAALYERWGIGTAQKEHGVLVLAVVDPSAVRPFDRAQGGERIEPQAHRPELGRGTGSGQATVTLGKSMLSIITPSLVTEVGSKYLEPAFRHGHFEEGLYRAVVALASASQSVQEGEPSRHKLKGFGAFLTLSMSLGALWFLWFISRPDLRHPYGRLRRGEFWGSGQGGFGGTFGGFGGGTNGEGLR